MMTIDGIRIMCMRIKDPRRRGREREREMVQNDGRTNHNLTNLVGETTQRNLERERARERESVCVCVRERERGRRERERPLQA